MIEHINKSFKGGSGEEVYALKDISVSIKDCEFVCIVGPTGCGKTTLLNMIAGLDEPTSGRIVFNDRNVCAPSPERAFVFQEAALFPWLNAIENVEFSMKMRGIPKRERREKAEKYLSMFHLTKFSRTFVHELSGGMKQRVAIARALAMDSEMLLMDEPFAAIDSQTKGMLHSELLQIWEETRKTIIFVTHSVEEAVLLADRVIIMTPTPGSIKVVVDISIQRPRSIEDRRVHSIISNIFGELKEGVNGFAKPETRNDDGFKENIVLLGADSGLGANL